MHMLITNDEVEFSLSIDYELHRSDSVLLPLYTALYFSLAAVQ